MRNTIRNLTDKEFELFKDLHPLFNGGLYVVHFESIDECEFDYFARKYGKEIFNNIHLRGYIHNDITSREMKEIMNVADKHKAFFIMEPKMKSYNASCGFWFSIVPVKEDENDKE